MREKEARWEAQKGSRRRGKDRWWVNFWVWGNTRETDRQRRGSHPKPRKGGSGGETG